MSDDGGIIDDLPVRRRKRRREKPPREHRRRRLRRHGRRAYIRSVYFLPSMATLGNAFCGFVAMYTVATGASWGHGPESLFTPYTSAAYLIFAAMVFDALDGRLARITRHTTDFGGQLDSLADVVSFGAAPAFLSILLIKSCGPINPAVDRLVLVIGALYMSCAALRLARFNVSNEHGEQHHFSFLGLPSPAAGGTVAAWVLMQQQLVSWSSEGFIGAVGKFCTVVLPLIVLGTGLLMVSHIRYPHLVNRYLRGKRSLGRLVAVLVFVLLLIVAHQYVAAVAMIAYVLWGATSAVARLWRAA